MTAVSLTTREARVIPFPARRRDSTRGGDHNKGKRFELTPLFADDVHQLYQALSVERLKYRPAGEQMLSAERLRAMIAVAYRTGMRISELLALQENDLQPEQRAILIRRGKGGYPRTVRMDEWGWRQLRRWLDIRHRWSTGYLFPTFDSDGQKPLESSQARAELRRLGQRAGLRKRAAWHQFRHGFSIEVVLIEGGNTVALQKALGHAHLGVTERYLRGVDTMRLTQAIADRPGPMISL